MADGLSAGELAAIREGFEQMTIPPGTRAYINADQMRDDALRLLAEVERLTAENERLEELTTGLIAELGKAMGKVARYEMIGPMRVGATWDRDGLREIQVAADAEDAE